MADSTHRTNQRTRSPVSRVEPDHHGAQVRIRFLVRSDRDWELELWAAQRQADLFRRVFGRKLELSAARTASTTGPAVDHEPGPGPFEFDWPSDSCPGTDGWETLVRP
jgi:hypothetical protein